MEDEERENNDHNEHLLLSSKSSQFSQKYILQYEDDELKNLRVFLSWACVDQSNPWKTSLSWSVLFLFSIGVPILSHFVLLCSTCDDEDHLQPFDSVVELSLSSISLISFFSLTNFARKLGIRRFLFLDKLYEQSERVRFGYSIQLQRSIKILCMFVVPCFIGDTAYKIWWYTTGGNKIPHFGNVIVSHTIACFLEQCSWLYRTSIFFLACVLYRVCCHLQILRLDDFAQVFQLETDVALVLMEHLRIRKTLRIISHRFRTFLLFTLLLVTASQFASLLVTTKSVSNIDVYTTGELALCSVTLVTGVCICLRSAAKITHKAQAITSLAAKWHVCATVDSLDAIDTGLEVPITTTTSFSPLAFPYNTHSDSDEEEGDGDDDLDNTKMVPVFAHTISYQKRQALVTYLENNRAGITIYGFMLDRSYLHTIFGVELSLVLWLLSKTVGIS
ncbi:hypothetical protein SOVF_003500 [Spinacia oleracea]|uniref:Extracellular ligand-gated ion channel protein n=1 Tax=Spinacia oleracea TaxID=3562 RepID=A0A9R0HZL4_SPIOL|nr:uncharacterized protein LOC110779582 [Spinacia oleracea]KNA25799.1 hypothetical protein SOVF_003500 [Spinacia oleracea]